MIGSQSFLLALTIVLCVAGLTTLLFQRIRQPVVLDYWRSEPPASLRFTTATNWEVKGYDCTYRGERYTWSKHHEYLRLIDLPLRTDATLELAMGLSGVTAEVRWADGRVSRTTTATDGTFVVARPGRVRSSAVLVRS